MEGDSLKPYSEWTEAKLRYAAVHLEELRRYRGKGTGDDFERAHEEAFLFHLLGAKDAFLQELNVCYGYGLPMDKVREATLLKAGKEKGRECPELQDLLTRQTKTESWLSVAKELRDHSTHRRNVPRVYDVGGDSDGKVRFEDPRTGEKLDRDTLAMFSTWLSELNALTKRLRESARKRLS